MLSTAALARLERLQLVTARRLAGDIAGEHRSTRHGSSLDFADFREYVPGDDSRRIDLHQLARLDVLRVKVYEGIDDLTVRMILDASGSMAFHGKFTAATDVVGGIAAVALANGDAMSLTTLPDAAPPRRFRGRDGVRALVDHLARIEPGGPSPFVDTARAVLSQRGPAGMVVVVSDLLAPEWREAISTLPMRGADVLVVHVMADEEARPELVGDLALVDSETGQRVPVSLTPERLQQYRERHAAWRDEVRSRVLQVGGRYLPVHTGDDVEDLLVRSWRRIGVVR